MSTADHLIKPSQAHAFARSDRSPLGVWWWTTDRWLLGAVAVLIGLGILLSFAASPAAAARMKEVEVGHARRPRVHLILARGGSRPHA